MITACHYFLWFKTIDPWLIIINPCLHQSKYTITSSKENTKIIVDPLQLFQKVCLVIYSLTSHFKGVCTHLYLKGALTSICGIEGYSLFGAIFWSRQSRITRRLTSLLFTFAIAVIYSDIVFWQPLYINRYMIADSWQVLIDYSVPYGMLGCSHRLIYDLVTSNHWIDFVISIAFCFLPKEEEFATNSVDRSLLFIQTNCASK